MSAMSPRDRLLTFIAALCLVPVVAVLMWMGDPEPANPPAPTVTVAP